MKPILIKVCERCAEDFETTEESVAVCSKCETELAEQLVSSLVSFAPLESYYVWVSRDVTSMENTRKLIRESLGGLILVHLEVVGADREKIMYRVAGFRKEKMQ